MNRYATPLSNGTRFGMLTVLEATEERSSTGERRYLCRCDCGEETIVTGGNLKNGGTRSCGCRKGNRTHGLRQHPLYGTWQAMLKRCDNPNSGRYVYYGARGITVCDRWRGPDGFPNFLADMGERPSGMTLDRIDNDGNYEPENCRWATYRQQRLNQRRQMV